MYVHNAKRSIGRGYALRRLRRGFGHGAAPSSARFWHRRRTGSHGEDSDDPFCSFWRGDDPRIHAELCELLNEEGIPHKTVRREDHLFNLNSKSGFQIGIPYSQFEKAEAAIKDAYGTRRQEDAARLLPYRKGYAPQFEAHLPGGRCEGFARTEDGEAKKPRMTGRRVLKRPLWTMTPRNGSRTGNPRTGIRGGHAAKCGRVNTLSGEMIEMALREIRFMRAFEKTDGKNAIFVLRKTKCAPAKL